MKTNPKLFNCEENINSFEIKDDLITPYKFNDTSLDSQDFIKNIDIGIFEPEKNINELISSIETRKENWIHYETIYSQIIQITKKSIIINCLIDPDNEIYRERIIPKEYLKDIVPFEIGNYVLIKQSAGKGKIVHNFENGNNITPTEYFEDDTEIDIEDIYMGEPL